MGRGIYINILNGGEETIRNGLLGSLKGNTLNFELFDKNISWRKLKQLTPASYPYREAIFFSWYQSSYRSFVMLGFNKSRLPERIANAHNYVILLKSYKNRKRNLLNQVRTLNRLILEPCSNINSLCSFEMVHLQLSLHLSNSCWVSITIIQSKPNQTRSFSLGY